MMTVVDFEKWRQERELAKLDRGELSSLLVQQADELAQLLHKATEAARRMSAVGLELSGKEGVPRDKAQAYVLFSTPLLNHLIASHDLAWNLVVVARDISKELGDRKSDPTPPAP
ncbi:hypothetical protein NKY66_11060 [Sinorhizobium meliloti]|uniref:hypothetical protein n=1 Tax=Rhizobium meliloti TaxID=382 RepID=UPI003D648188